MPSRERFGRWAPHLGQFSQDLQEYAHTAPFWIESIREDAGRDFSAAVGPASGDHLYRGEQAPNVV